MMRSLFSGISGLKVHQTKMDVIGNNIANVNTAGFRASSVNFTDVFYQTTQSASGPDESTDSAGTNAMQIGLGANVAAISVNLSGTGSTQRTERGMDVMINGDAFFIVSSGGQTYFTKSGAFDIDADGTLCCTTNGAKVLGWGTTTNADGTQEIRKDTVSALDLMSAENEYSAPRATTDVTLSGNLDNKDSQVQVDGTGYPVSISFYDQLGALYSAKLSFQLAETEEGSSENTSIFTVKVTDILSSSSTSSSSSSSALVHKATEAELESGSPKYSLTDLAQSLNFNGSALQVSVNEDTGEVSITTEGDWPQVKFNSATGAFQSVSRATNEGDEDNQETLNLTLSNATENGTAPDGQELNTFPTGGVEIDFRTLTMYSTNGTSKVTPTRGNYQNQGGAGNQAGNLNGISIQTDGMIYGVYSNGDSKLLGQIAVATFTNPSGLESMGSSLYAATQNSGEFDGVGVNITEVGSLSIGALEMSDVDLATEFTSMITTQRGFQANSRVITTSDTMLEELVNLKR